MAEDEKMDVLTNTALFNRLSTDTPADVRFPQYAQHLHSPHDVTFRAGRVLGF
jgi:hypothetical protein